MKKLLLSIFLLSPLFLLIYELFIIRDVTDPIKYIYTITGSTSVVLIFTSISFSMIKKWINFLKYRKLVGIFGFFYALLHFLNFYILDAQFDINFVIKESFEKPFIYLGMFAFFILFFMFLTSTKKAFRKYNKYHKLVYLALIFITIHFVMAQKSLSILDFIYIIIIIIIGYFKLLQQIVRKNNL